MKDLNVNMETELEKKISLKIHINKIKKPQILLYKQI